MDETFIKKIDYLSRSPAFRVHQTTYLHSHCASHLVCITCTHRYIHSYMVFKQMNVTKKLRNFYIAFQDVYATLHYTHDTSIIVRNCL